MREIKFRAWNELSKMMMLPGESFHLEEGVLDAGDWELMQYTGLKDNNGVNLFEGDIIVDHNGTGIVEYSRKYAGFRVNYKDGFCKWFYDYYLQGELESIEVIGNIHQNPERMKIIMRIKNGR